MREDAQAARLLDVLPWPCGRPAPSGCGAAPPTPTGWFGSICPYCAVGCGQQVYVTDGKITQIEGDPDSPDLPGQAVPQGRTSTSTPRWT